MILAAVAAATFMLPLLTTSREILRQLAAEIAKAKPPVY
jgi:hypothetical protein